VKKLSALIFLVSLSGFVFADGIPSNHPFAKISEGMDSSEVSSVLGRPTRKTKYQTGKGFIPGAGRWLNDTRRQSWFYKGKGSIVLSKNKYSGLYLVREVNYDPNQK